MSDASLGETRLFAGNYPPLGWLFCTGQSLSIAENTALFALIGTTYGGDGISTFNLPNLSDRVPMGQGQGPGLTPRWLGQQLGDQDVQLSLNQLPAHNHTVLGLNTTADKSMVAETVLPGKVTNLYSNAKPGNTTLDANSLAAAGGSQPHNNMMLSTGMNYIICIAGIFPSRN